MSSTGGRGEGRFILLGLVILGIYTWNLQFTKVITTLKMARRDAMSSGFCMGPAVRSAADWAISIEYYSKLVMQVSTN